MTDRIATPIAGLDGQGRNNDLFIFGDLTAAKVGSIVQVTGFTFADGGEQRRCNHDPR